MGGVRLTFRLACGGPLGAQKLAFQFTVHGNFHFCVCEFRWSNSGEGEPFRPATRCRASSKWQFSPSDKALSFNLKPCISKPFPTHDIGGGVGSVHPA